MESLKRPPPIELRQLHAFRIVADELHFGRAAKRLGIAQPPLSQQVRRLEQTLGYALFDRDTRKVRLTAGGAALLIVANAVLTRLDVGLERAHRIATGAAGRLTIGFTPTTALRILPAIVQAFRRDHEGIELELYELLPDAMREALASEQIDLALMREPLPEPGIEIVPLIDEAFVAVLPETHAMADPAVPFQLDALAEDPFVLFPSDHASQSLTRILAVCAFAGFAPHIVQEVPGWQTAISMVGSGMGVSILPESVTMLHLPGIVYRRIEAPIGYAVCLLRRADDARPMVGDFLACARAVMAG